jgi:hypothetical protein
MTRKTDICWRREKTRVMGDLPGRGPAKAEYGTHPSTVCGKNGSWRREKGEGRMEKGKKPAGRFFPQHRPGGIVGAGGRE